MRSPQSSSRFFFWLAVMVVTAFVSLVDSNTSMGKGHTGDGGDDHAALVYHDPIRQFAGRRLHPLSTGYPHLATSDTVFQWSNQAGRP